MIQQFITTIEELKATVKVNKSDTFFSNLNPYLDDAYFRYIEPYLGAPLCQRLFTKAENDRQLFDMVCMSLGPFGVAIGSPELGIILGDSGHMVSKNEKFTVASDAKIARAEEGLMVRGWNALDRAIGFLHRNESEYSEWSESLYVKNRWTGHYINNVNEFQLYGGLDLRNSSLGFDRLRTLMDPLEYSISMRLGPTIDALLRQSPDSSTGTKEMLLKVVRRWLVCSTAAAFTSCIPPLESGIPVVLMPNDHGYWKARVKELDDLLDSILMRFNVELGLSANGGFVNTKESHIFTC